MDFSMYSGNSKALIVTVLDKPNGSPVSLASAQAIKWQLFHSTPITADPIVSKSLLSGVTVTDAAGGVFTVSIAASDTAGLSGSYYHETEVTDSAGNKETVDSGFINIKAKRIV